LKYALGIFFGFLLFVAGFVSAQLYNFDTHIGIAAAPEPSNPATH
jgi:hypothetical protein